MEVEWTNYMQFEDELKLVGELASVSTGKDEPEKYIAIARHCIKSGHFTPTRTMRFLFKIEGISRVVSHEFVRHEVGVIKVQESQRYVDAGNAEFVVPKEVKLREEEEQFELNICNSFADYQDMLDAGYKKEIARYTLTNATCTKLNICFNWEGLSNFLQKRLCARVQPEMRELAMNILKQIYLGVPTQYHDLLNLHMGRKCDIVGYCNEVQCCGYKPTREKFFATYERGKFIEEMK